MCASRGRYAPPKAAADRCVDKPGDRPALADGQDIVHHSLLSRLCLVGVVVPLLHFFSSSLKNITTKQNKKKATKNKQTNKQTNKQNKQTNKKHFGTFSSSAFDVMVALTRSSLP